MSTKKSEFFSFTGRNLLIFVCIIILTPVSCNIILYFDSHTDVGTIFLLSVFLTALFTSGYFFSSFASLISVVELNYFYIYPYNEFNLTNAGNLTTSISIFTVAIVTSFITSHRKSQQKIKEIAQKEKMQGTLLRAISHDLRTPLTSISGIANLISEEKELSKKDISELAKSIRQEADWLVRMVENLLTVTKITGSGQDIDKEPEIIDEICAEVSNKIKLRYKNLNVKVSVSEDLMFVPMDALLIEQVMINIVDNSVKHGKYAQKIHIEAAREDNYARISVIDDGCGMDENLIKMWFEEDIDKHKINEQDTTKNMGIGLSVCKVIVKAHKGRIEAEKALPHGLNVSIYLPLGGE